MTAEYNYLGCAQQVEYHIGLLDFYASAVSDRPHKRLKSKKLRPYKRLKSKKLRVIRHIGDNFSSAVSKYLRIIAGQSESRRRKRLRHSVANYSHTANAPWNIRQERPIQFLPEQALSINGKMLRKSSRSNKATQLEQERRAREKARSSEVPRLPAPDLSTFGSDNEGRVTANPLFADSPFLSNGTTNLGTTNFSRPHPGGVMPSSSNASSSSPAYNWRSPSLNSSSPLPGTAPSTVDSHSRTESMTHRGRYSYASSAAGLNSPRRVRRRKDPTPFK